MCEALPWHDRATADAYAARALELLTQLQRDDYCRDTAKQQYLDKDEDLEALRSRADFKCWRDNLSPKG